MNHKYDVSFSTPDCAPLSRIDRERLLHQVIGQGLWLTDVRCSTDHIVSTEPNLGGKVYQVSNFRSTIFGYGGPMTVFVSLESA